MKRLIAFLLLLCALCSPLHARSYVLDGTWRYGVTLTSGPDYIRTPGISGSLTSFEFWVKLPYAYASEEMLFNTEGDGVNWEWRVGGVYGLGANALGPSYQAISGRGWQHCAVTYANDGQICTATTYFNGTVRSTALVASSTFPNVVSNKYVQLGSYFPTNTTHLRGSIKNFRIWNYVRTQQEIQSQASWRLTGRENGLLLYLPGDDGVNGDPVLPQTVFGPSSFDAAAPSVLNFNGTSDGSVATISAVSLPCSFGGWLVPPSAGFANNKYAAISLSSGTVNTAYMDMVFGRADATSNANWSGWFPIASTTEVAYTTQKPFSRPIHLAGVYETTASRTFYVDGVPVISNTSTVAHGIGLNRIGFGTRPRATPAYYQGGSRSGFVYSKALSQAEIIACKNSSTPPFSDGLVCWYPLTETVGSTAYDLSPNGYHGTITGGSRVSLTPKTIDPVSYVSYPAFAERYSAARTLFYDNSNDITTATLASSTGYPISMGGWFQLPAAVADNRQCSMFLASSAVDNSYLGMEVMRLDSVTTGNYVVNINSAANTTVKKNTLIPLGSPIHVVFVAAATTDQRIYINGKLFDTQAVAISSPLLKDKVSFGGGARLTPIYRTGYNHSMFLFNRELTPAEIAQQQYMNSPVSYDGLIDFWPMSEGTGNCTGVLGTVATVTGATWSTLGNSNGSITGTSQGWIRTLVNAFPPSFRSFITQP